MTKWLVAQCLLLFLAPLQVGCFRISRFIPDGFFFQIKHRVRGKSSALSWCQCYYAIWSDSREHSENVFRQNPCTLSRWPRLTPKTFFECSRELDQIAELRLHHQKELDFPRTLRFIWTNSIRYEKRYPKNSYLKRRLKIVIFLLRVVYAPTQKAAYIANKKRGVQQTYFLVKNEQYYLCCQYFYQA